MKFRIAISFLPAAALVMMLTCAPGVYAQTADSEKSLIPKRDRPGGGKKKGPQPGSKAGDQMLRRMGEFERLDRMPDDERQRALERLPAPRRQRIEEGLARYRAMDPENRERLKRFEQMAPEQRESIRENFRRMQELNPGRRILVRREVQRLRNVDPAERGTRMQSDAFRKRFDQNEQDLIRETIANLPTPQ